MSLISVVVPVYNEQDCLKGLFDQRPHGLGRASK